MKLTKAQARALSVYASGLARAKPFTDLVSCVEHIGYVQIDTISVIERAHHHILWTRLPDYQPAQLSRAVSHDKQLLEAWAHALAFVPVSHFKFYLPEMREFERDPGRWYASVTPSAVSKLKRRITQLGSVTLDDFEDDPRVEKDHDWASTKPSKCVLQYLFHAGHLTIAERHGMKKRYAPTLKHFGWERFPRPATKREQLEYRIERALRVQGLSSANSICHLCPSLKKQIAPLLEKQVRAGQLVQIEVTGSKLKWFAKPETLRGLEAHEPESFEDRLQFLSPFDPLVIQRQWLKEIFDFEYSFEAYVPKAKRKYGYFSLPILYRTELIGLIDLKTDRVNRKVLVQSRHIFKKIPKLELLTKEAIKRFEKLQCAKGADEN
jgi:uncharacterized protein YcaQ